MFAELIENEQLEPKTKLNASKIRKILEYIECDEFLAKDIRSSITRSIKEALDEDKI